MPDYYICHPIQTGTTPLCFVFTFGPRYLELGYFVFPVLRTQNDGFVLVFSVTYYRLFEILFPLS